MEGFSWHGADLGNDERDVHHDIAQDNNEILNHHDPSLDTIIEKPKPPEGILRSDNEHEKDTDDDDTSGHPCEGVGSLASFHGRARDDYNYNYYMNEAESHKKSAERYERDAADREDWARRYSSEYPEKARLYLQEAENWACKAKSEWVAYRDALRQASSYQ